MKKKSNILSFVLILLSVLALFIYISVVDGFNNVLGIFVNCNKFWFFVGFLVMVSFWGFDYLILNVGLEIFDKKLKFKDGVKNCMLGQFFNNITPSATGGQPFQAFFMNRYCGIGYGMAVGALIVKFLCFQIGLTFFCSFLLFLRFKYFASKIQGFAIFLFFGFLINAFVAIFLILIGLNKKFTVVLIGFFVKILAKLRIFKETEKKLINIKKEVDLFNETIVIAFKNIKKLLKMVFFSILQIFVLYFINVVIALIFDIKIDFNHMFNIICGAACVQISSIFVPLPGAVGGAEFLFFLIYDGVFARNKMSAALLLWRIYTLYLPIIIGLILSKTLFKGKEREEINIKIK